MPMNQDLSNFVETARALKFFDRGASLIISRAPGRLDVMGGIADYSGSLVLERPIAEGTCAAVQPVDGAVLEVISIGRPPLSVPIATLIPDGEPIAYEAARRRFAQGDQRGAACGVMDQMTCVFGEPDALMALLCQPAELQPPVPLGDLSVWGIDSGERHAVSAFDYGAVRAGAFMGLRILADHLRVPGEYLA